MSEVVHKYMCAYCKRYVFANSTVSLAVAVNEHNLLMHPMDFANWTASGIVLSACYSGMNGPLPQYLAPYGTTSRGEWGDAKNPPNITDQDRAMLSQGLVKW